MNEERMKILKMIEEGKITAEEGAKLLGAVSDEQETTSEKKAAGSTSKYGIKNFFDDAVEKIKNSDFDLSFGEYKEFDHHTDLSPDSFKDLDIFIANGSLTLNVWDGDYAKADYHVKVYQVETEEEAREQFLSDHQFDIKEGLLRLASPSKKVKTNVELTIPEQNYDFLKAKLSNGVIHVDHLNSQHTKFKTSNGKVHIAGIKGETCKIETGNGAVMLTAAELDTCEVDTINGTVQLSGSFGKSDVSTMSGSITVNHHENHAHTGFYKTTAGQVKVTLPHSCKVDGVARTKIGNIYCNLENYKIIQDKKDVVNKVLEFEAYEHNAHLFHIEAETKTGSITISPASM
ncbi:hypothetical protein EQV77_12815 [Halobacillus fulvus]|nr:hypothetical protein EQV77_12815 [Halobacillus fulvus]